MQSKNKQSASPEKQRRGMLFYGCGETVGN